MILRGKESFSGKEHIFKSKTGNPYTFDLYGITEATEQSKELERLYQELYSEIHAGRNPELFKERAKTHRRFLDITYLLVSRKDTDEYIAIGRFILISSTPREDKSGVYPEDTLKAIKPADELTIFSSRAIKEGYRGEGIGRHLLELVTKYRWMAKYVVIMTQNEYSILSALKISRCAEGYPIGKDFDPQGENRLNLYTSNTIVQDNLIKTYEVFRSPESEGILIKRGVSLGEVKNLGPNPTVNVGEEGKGTGLAGIMTGPPPDGLGMNIAEGDELWETLVLKPDL